MADAPNIVYTSSEGFLIDLTNSVRKHRMQQFDHRYRSADVLLIDDIQLLMLTTRSQLEFFHTFDDLFERRKQIVLSGDSAPRDIPGLLEGLRLRLERGLMVEIKPPDVATKMAILEAKAAAEGITLTEDVRSWIATMSGDVRALKAALLKLLAYSSLTGEPIDLEMAQQLIWWPPRRPFSFL
jgi:chromosomal replication initiator protein